MTDIRDWGWQHKYGLSQLAASRRVDEAARVIRSTGSLVPVAWGVDNPEFESTLRQPFQPRPGQVDTLEPDYIAFMFFALTQLDWLHEAYGNEVEKVDFWVEENGKITPHMRHFHGQLADGLNYINRPELAALVGRLRPFEKEQIPPQAADMLGWHARNAARGALDREGHRRYWQMITGDSSDPRKGRFGHRGTINADDLRALAEGFAKYYVTPASEGGGAA